MKTKLALVLLFGLSPLIASAAQMELNPEFHEVADHLAPSNALNVLTFSAPRSIAVRDLGLDSVGLTAGPVLTASAELRIFANRDAMNASPKARLWLNSLEGGRWWFLTGGTGVAEEYVIQPGEAVLLITRNSANEIAWTNVFTAE